MVPNVYDLLMILTTGAALFFTVWRWRLIARALKLKEEPKRHFYWFILWYLPWPVLVWFTPLWSTQKIWFGAAILSLLAANMTDFFYFFGLKSQNRFRQQYTAAGWAVVPMALWLATSTLSPNPILLAPPHHGRAVTWTDRPLKPRVFYFIRPEPRAFHTIKDKYDDPNYGQGIFAPMEGTAVGWQDQKFLIIQATGGSKFKIALGPFLRESVHIQPGAAIQEHQPLGLADRGHPIPGLQIRVLGDHPVAFKQVLMGFWFARPYEQTPILRNRYIQSFSKNRFSLR